MKQVFSPSNETSVKSTGVGSGIAIIVVFILAKIFTISSFDAGVIVGAMTTIFNYIINKETFNKKVFK